MSIPDNLITEYFNVYTDIPLEEIYQMEKDLYQTRFAGDNQILYNKVLAVAKREIKISCCGIMLVLRLIDLKEVGDR